MWMLGGIKFMHIIKFVFVFLAIPLAVVGFRKKHKPLALLAFCFIIFAYGLAEMSKNKPFIPAKVEVRNAGSEPYVSGEQVYLANCVFCHGVDGKKMYRGAIDLTKSTLSPELIAQMVREGSKGKMPSYANRIPEDQLAALSQFVVELRTDNLSRE